MTKIATVKTCLAASLLGLAGLSLTACTQAPQIDAQSPNSQISDSQIPDNQISAPSATSEGRSPYAIQTPSPVIYLADNLDEPGQNGWCIDTQGRNFSETLHTHSCKPAGGDVQFSYDEASGQIRSVPYTGKCAQLLAPSDTARFGLLDCDAANAAQRFDYDSAAMELSVRGDRASCISAGAQSRQAGPWVARDLNLTPCADTPAGLKQWVVLPL